MKKTILSLGLLLALPVAVFAQEEEKPITAADVDVALEIPKPADLTIEEGLMICSSPGGYKACDSAHSQDLFGVVSLRPALSIESADIEDGMLVIKQGEVSVRVTNQSGSIVQGDYITSSDTPGLGQKATRNGYVFGTALENYDSSVPGTIKVAANIQTINIIDPGASENLVKTLQEGATTPFQSPLASLRYLVAALLVLLSFAFAMWYYVRMSRDAIQAIGRNPLASKNINMSVLFQAFVTITIVIVGFGAAYLVLAF